jgi:hypothetical protein
VPLTTRPAFTSRQAMMRFVSMKRLFHHGGSEEREGDRNALSFRTK